MTKGIHPMAAMKPRTGDGPMEAAKEGRGIVMRVPLEGGGRLVVELTPDEATTLAEELNTVTSGPRVSIDIDASGDLVGCVDSSHEEGVPDARSPLATAARRPRRRRKRSGCQVGAGHPRAGVGPGTQGAAGGGP